MSSAHPPSLPHLYAGEEAPPRNERIRNLLREPRLPIVPRLTPPCHPHKPTSHLNRGNTVPLLGSRAVRSVPFHLGSIAPSESVTRGKPHWAYPPAYTNQDLQLAPFLGREAIIKVNQRHTLGPVVSPCSTNGVAPCRSLPACQSGGGHLVILGRPIWHPRLEGLRRKTASSLRLLCQYKKRHISQVY